MPQATPEPDAQASEIQLDAEGVADIAHEAPIPLENPIANLTTRSGAMGTNTKMS
jgi:hypothetical protein